MDDPGLQEVDQAVVAGEPLEGELVHPVQLTGPPHNPCGGTAMKRIERCRLLIADG